MGFIKDLLIKDDRNEDDRSEDRTDRDRTRTAPVTSFPGRESPPERPAASVHDDEVLNMYERGFEKLNQPGPDFFEFYKAVAASPTKDAAEMALGMLRAMAPDLTKAVLLEQSKGYVSEIEKAHRTYAEQGDERLRDLEARKAEEADRLKSEADDYRRQLEDLQRRLRAAEADLQRIDERYGPQIEEVRAKRAANDRARSTLVGSIERVANLLR